MPTQSGEMTVAKLFGRLIPRHLLRSKELRVKASRAVHQKSPESPLVSELKSRINATGPLTLADYMREVLLHPIHGYYITRDSIGQHGDFVTSPEISQVFGELLVVWCIDQWCKMGRPPECQIIELGPGRGTLASDILRILSKLPEADRTKFSLHLVEVSPHFQCVQEEELCGLVQSSTTPTEFKTRRSKYAGIPVFWYPELKFVPRKFSCVFAHEFLDALPIHKFRRTANGWREILVDVDDSIDGPHHFRFIISRAPTPASLMYVPRDESRDEVEISVSAILVVQEIALRLEEDGGCALLVDYGHNGDKCDTFRSFKKHGLHHPLSEPGTADLTADVDFQFLRSVLTEKALTYGAITQGEFLKNMGIDLRMVKLLQSCSQVQRASLRSAYEMLVNSDKMGERFKMLAMFPLVMEGILSKYPPSGFVPLVL